jgi:hypothetical protein
LGAGSAGFAAAAGIVARTAAWQAPDSALTFFCRHISASLPPGVTPEQCDMKSERQFPRIALCCALEICACAIVAADRAAPAAKTARIARLIVYPRKSCSPRAAEVCEVDVSAGARIVSGKNFGANGR